MTRQRYLGLILAAITATVVAWTFHHHHSKQRAISADAKRLEAAINEASQIGNTVVSARDHSGNSYMLRGLECERIASVRSNRYKRCSSRRLYMCRSSTWFQHWII